MGKSMFFFCKLSALAEKYHPMFPVISFAASLSFTNLFEANVNRQTEINVLGFLSAFIALKWEMWCLLIIWIILYVKTYSITLQFTFILELWWCRPYVEWILLFAKDSVFKNFWLEYSKSQLSLMNVVVTSIEIPLLTRPLQYLK